MYQTHQQLQKTGCGYSKSILPALLLLKPHLGHKLSIYSDAGAAIIVKAIAVAALLIGVQVHAASFGSAIPDQVQPLMQLPQLQAPLPLPYGPSATVNPASTQELPQ